MDFYEVTRHTLARGTLADVALGCRDDYEATQEILGLVEAADKGQAWLLARERFSWERGRQWLTCRKVKGCLTPAEEA